MASRSEAPIRPGDVQLPAQWEYATVTGLGNNPLANLNPTLNEYGRAGWELVAMDGRFPIFKRPFVGK